MMMNDSEKRKNVERRFSTDHFSVPVRYLEMIAGKNSLSPASLTENPDNREPHISSLQFIELCLHHFRTSGRETLSTAPIAIPLGSFGLIVSGIAQARDFEGALRKCAEVMQILRPDMTATFAKSARRLRLDIKIKGPSPAKTEIGLEFFVVALHSAFRWLTGERLPPAHARAAGRRAGHERSLLTILCCPISRDGAGVTLSYATGFSKLPIRPVKYQNWAAHELPEFLRLLNEAAEYWNSGETGPNTLIVARVTQMVREGVTSEPAVARILGTSSASLRRQLAENATSFREILSEVRRELVCQLLATEKSLAEIAEQAGYSDERSLRRACSKWFGQSPTVYREAARLKSVSVSND